MTDDGLSGAGITAKERLTNIELILTRMDVKLDGKANQSEVDALKVEVHALQIQNATTFDTKVRLDKVEAAQQAAGKRMATWAGAIGVLVVVANIGGAFLVTHL